MALQNLHLQYTCQSFETNIVFDNFRRFDIDNDDCSADVGWAVSEGCIPKYIFKKSRTLKRLLQRLFHALALN